MLKILSLMSIVSISLFALSPSKAAYVPITPIGNEVEIYPDYSKQIKDNLDAQKQYNQNVEPKEIIMNNNEDETIIDNNKSITNTNDIDKKNYDLYNNGIKPNTNEKDIVTNIQNIKNIEKEESIDNSKLTTPYEMQEIIIKPYEEEQNKQ